jgi:hypothetical protein
LWLRGGQGSRLQREVAAAAVWLPSWAGGRPRWVVVVGPAARWAGPEGPMGVPAGMGVRPQRGPGWQRALPARYRQRCDLRKWLVGLPGLEPGTSSLSGIEGSALCGPAFPQVAGERQGRRDAFLAVSFQAVQASPLAPRHRHLHVCLSGVQENRERWIGLMPICLDSRTAIGFSAQVTTLVSLLVQLLAHQDLAQVTRARAACPLRLGWKKSRLLTWLALNW